MVEVLTNSEFNQWRTDSVTKKIVAQLRSKEAYLKQQWVDGKFADEIEDAYQRGFINGMFEIFAVEYVTETE